MLKGVDWDAVTRELRAKGAFVVDPRDEEAKTLARLLGWKDGSDNDLVTALTRRDELCKQMRANKILDAGIVEQDIKPGSVRCVVFGMGCAIVDVEAPLSMAN